MFLRNKPKLDDIYEYWSVLEPPINKQQNVSF